MRAVLDAKDLSLTFSTADGPVYALSGVNLKVEDGDFVSFIGPSGCGKTTLLRVIADLEQRKTLIRDAAQREILYDLDIARRGIFEREKKSREFDVISRSHANLLRMWMDG